MANFFTARENIHNSTARICGDEAAHILRVLRMKKGDALTVCDMEGFFYDGIIESIENKDILVSIGERYAAQSEPDVFLTLYQAVTKGTKMDLVTQKATELGVSRIVPVLTKRSVAKMESANKAERLCRVAMEACKQSRRGRVPEISGVITFEEAVEEMKESGLAVLLYEDEATLSLRKALEGSNVRSVSLFIGPEGGFEADEVALARSVGIKSASMGKRILRAETAAISACAIAMYALGEMGD
ncbi:MAG: RsmE family RNA methyltransferase [Clostridia bacterium]|nr:RsmE family RNA methyltransferase [Clostridia bacterium]